MSLDELDPVLTPPKRLAALGVLDVSRRVEFSFLRDHLGLSDSDLSKQLKALTDAGYAESRRTGRGRSRTTWFSVTDKGSAALATHAAALRSLVTPPAPPAADAITPVP
ncbi:MAG: transcriptional regulator [Acidimicrobiales bacterium]